MKKNPVVHFEMPYKDDKRVSAFYTKVFGWNMTDSGKSMGNYLMATTGETDEKGMPTKSGFINGGFYDLDAAKEANAPSVVIAVDNLQASMKDIKAGGGKLLGKPMDIPGVGMYISFIDTEGNRVGILQPSMK